MHAWFKPCQGTVKLVDYNEAKVGDDRAKCIYAGNFFGEGTTLSAEEKRQYFEERTDLNQRTGVNGVSIVLEFAPGRTLEQDDLIDIAVDYMHGIGYARQPYLIYAHDDTACQHLHIVTTNIEHDGKRIPQRDIVFRLIQPVRKAINAKYGLDNSSDPSLKPHDPRQKIIYGKTFTREAMAGTLQYVMDNYRYRNLAEFNAVLRLYNLRVISGEPGSWLRRHRGLLYQVLNDLGKPMNAPTKASEFDFKPTLTRLEERFAIDVDVRRTRLVLNEAIKEGAADAGRSAAAARSDRAAGLLDSAGLAPAAGFSDLLRRNRLAAVPFFDRQGGLSELFFVDLATKSVVSPNDLGVGYDADGIRGRLGFDPFVRQMPPLAVQRDLGNSRGIQTPDEGLER